MASPPGAAFRLPVSRAEDVPPAPFPVRGKEGNGRRERAGNEGEGPEHALRRFDDMRECPRIEHSRCDARPM